MMKWQLIFILGVILGCSLPMLAMGVDWRVLRYSPVYYFTDEDHRLLKQAGQDALENQPDGTTVSWKNPATNNSGTVTPLTTYQDHGTICRKVEIFNSAHGQTAKSYFNFCKQPDGTWKVAP